MYSYKMKTTASSTLSIEITPSNALNLSKIVNTDSMSVNKPNPIHLAPFVFMGAVSAAIFWPVAGFPTPPLVNQDRLDPPHMPP